MINNGIVFEWQYGCYSGIGKIETGHYNKDVVKAGLLSDDEDCLDSLSFWLFEGNFCCDCNRRLAIENYIWDSEDRCSEDIIINHAKFYKDGVYIGWGCDWDYYMIGENYGDYLGGEVPF